MVGRCTPTRIGYARVFLFAPLVVGYALPVAAPLLSVVPHWGLALALGYLVVGAWLARIPYILFAVSALVVLWKRDGEVYFRLAPLAPLAFLPFLAIYLYASEILGRTGGSLISDSVALGWWLLIALPFGYVYVGLFFVGARIIFGTRARVTRHMPI